MTRAWVAHDGAWRNGDTVVPFGSDGGGGGAVADWSETNPPWAYTSTDAFTEKWPDGVQVVPLAGSGTDLYARLNSTLNATTGRVVVQLAEGVHRLNQFRVYGTSGNILYAFGFFFPRLQGLLGAGPDKTFVQMDASSLTQEQLDAMALLDPQTFSPLGMGLCRFDGTTASPVLLAGLTFRAADQQMLTSKHPNLNVHIPQPAPHNGVVIYQSSPLIASYVRFQAAGRGVNSQPPFECANITSQYGPSIRYDHCEFDGRRSPDLDPARPRRCGTIMGNNETLHVMEDCWLHHSNISRYAVNDQNRDTSGQYIVRRCKAEQITNNQNRDPALNGGASLGGCEDATPFGWESCNGTILVEDSIVSQDNPQSNVGVPMLFQLTSVGNRNPQGGRFTVTGTQFRWTAHPHLDGFCGFRISQSTYWWQDGFDTTLTVRHPETDVRLQPYVATGSWPPSAQTLAAAGVTPATHYIVRRT